MNQKYELDGILFSKKLEITEKCRMILNNTPDNDIVQISESIFLFDLFKYHDEWDSKSSGGVCNISVQTTEHGTRCFVLLKNDSQKIDISYPHCIKLIPTKRTKNLTPQRLLDYKNGARTAIKSQIRAFRDEKLRASLNCPYTKEVINRDNYAIDHTPPKTFDKLLFDFTVKNSIKPLGIKIVSKDGVVAEFYDKKLEKQWQVYHKQHAELRILSKKGNAQLKRINISWEEVL